MTMAMAYARCDAYTVARYARYILRIDQRTEHRGSRIAHAYSNCITQLPATHA